MEHQEGTELVSCKTPELMRNYEQMDEKTCQCITHSQNFLKPALLLASTLKKTAAKVLHLKEGDQACDETVERSDFYEN